MINRSQINSFVSSFPAFNDISLALNYAPRMPRAMVKETQKVIAIARKFNEEVTRPMSLKLDRKTFEDPDYFPWELVKKANEWRLYSMWIPRLFGGQGFSITSIYYFLEEIASVDVGIANVIGVHYLGFICLLMSCNTRVIKKVVNEVLHGEKTGDPCLVSLSLTEPGAGTDIEEVDLMDKGKMSCHAKKVKGGYILNGTKVFISNGHVSNWTIVYSFADLNKAGDSMVVMMVRKGMKGLSFGTHENKMGQRICPASEVIFDDCFVPDNLVVFEPDKLRKFTKQPARDIIMRHLDYFWCGSRPGVSAFGTGAARGAYEVALEYCIGTELNGSPMVDYEWVQCRLAEMYTNAKIGRLAWIDSVTANSHRGMLKLLQMKPMYYFLKHFPRILFTTISPFLSTSLSIWFMSKYYLDLQKPEDQHLCTGIASMAKFTGTDMGVKNCQIAVELMGAAGMRSEQRIEKILRDAKLLQIYEGTNQLNRLNVFKSLIAAPACPNARLFEV